MFTGFVVKKTIYIDAKLSMKHQVENVNINCITSEKSFKQRIAVNTFNKEKNKLEKLEFNVNLEKSYPSKQLTLASQT